VFRVLDALDGSFSVEDQDAVLIQSRRLIAEGGIFDLTRGNVNLVVSEILRVEAGDFSVAGQPAGVIQFLQVGGPGIFNLSERDALLTASRERRFETANQNTPIVVSQDSPRDRVITFYIKQNDTVPSIRADLFSGNGDPIDLIDASVRFRMRKTRGKTGLVDSNALVISETDGVVQYDWAAEDTAETGSCQAEFEVTYPDGTVETFPNNEYIHVQIIDDIA
jgi:hypothetical protein